ncbi:MAG: hypothetical protein ACRDQ4_24540, partial [Pseudonocardiaceae bacterium]
MTANRAILYRTVNGVCSNTNGLGRQTKTLLSGCADVFGGLVAPGVSGQGPGKVLFRQIDAHRSLNERGDHDLVCSQCAEFDMRAARPAS